MKEGAYLLYIEKIEDGLKVFKALSSKLRIDIVKLLLENKEMNMNEIAKSLNITSGALTSHMKRLEESGIVRVNFLSENIGHGNQKICTIGIERILIDVDSEKITNRDNVYEVDIPIGHYTNYNVYPTCGISTKKNLIGEVDVPQYFAHKERMNADICWFTKGFIEYIIPNFVPTSKIIDQITVSMELSSEAPGVNSDWPSDISFHINDNLIGTWTSPGDFGDIRGIFTPDWWLPNWNQYGILKMLVINKRGTYIDGFKISDVNIEQFELDYKSLIRFKLMVADDADNIGGLTIFGKNFGNYNQDIKVRVSYCDP